MASNGQSPDDGRLRGDLRPDAQNALGPRGSLEQLRGSMATAWIDERIPGRMHLARGVARPLWIGCGRRELFFASTKAALEVVEETLRLKLRKHELPEGRMLHLERGRIETDSRFRTDGSYRDKRVLPSVRSPREGVSCRAKLAALAA